MALSEYDRETLRINHRIRLEPQVARQKAQDEAHQAQIAAARENLRKAVSADKAAGLDQSAELRNVRPVRPNHILDVQPGWDWEPAKVTKLREAQQRAQAEYYEHLVLANPTLLSPEQLKELPAAIRFCDAAVKAAEAAQEGNK